MPPRLAVRDIAFFERPVTFARPFRFGAVVINATPQAVRAGRDRGRRQGQWPIGASAELLVPKWFDKRPHLSPEETVDGIAALAADRARALSGAFRLRDGVRPARGLHRRAGRGLREGRYPAAGRGLRAGRNRQGDPGCAAALRPASISSTAWRRTSPGSMRGCRAISAMRISRSSWPAASGWSASRSGTPSASTIKVEGEGGVADIKENAGARYFKLKLNGDPAHDAERLIRIGKELATLPYDYQRHAGCQRAICRSRRAGRAGRAPRPRQRAEADRVKTALYRAADAARYHPAIAARRAGAAAISSSTRPTIPTMPSRRRARSAIAASPRNPARASTNRSSTRRAPPNGARKATRPSSPART